VTTTILLVDDSPTMRRMVTASLREIPGAHFVEAGSGLEAIEKLALAPAALVILDLNMPDMHGLEVLQFLRGHQRYRAVPVIVLTTRGDESSRAAAMAAGATAYVTKPFVPRVLAAQAHAALEATRTSVQA
jgi:two-component system chemotaxis response regulator CheY